VNSTKQLSTKATSAYKPLYSRSWVKMAAVSQQ